MIPFETEHDIRFQCLNPEKKLRHEIPNYRFVSATHHDHHHHRHQKRDMMTDDLLSRHTRI